MYEHSKEERGAKGLRSLKMSFSQQHTGGKRIAQSRVRQQETSPISETLPASCIQRPLTGPGSNDEIGCRNFWGPILFTGCCQKVGCSERLGELPTSEYAYSTSV